MTLLDSRLPYIIQASLVNVFHLLQWTHNLSRTLGIWLPWWLSNKEYCCQCKRCIRHRFSLWVGKIPWRRKWQPTPVSFSGKFHGQRSPVGCTLWGHRESDTTQQLSIQTNFKEKADAKDILHKELLLTTMPCFLLHAHWDQKFHILCVAKSPGQI